MSDRAPRKPELTLAHGHLDTLVPGHLEHSYVGKIFGPTAVVLAKPASLCKNLWGAVRRLWKSFGRNVHLVHSPPPL